MNIRSARTPRVSSARISAATTTIAAVASLEDKTFHVIFDPIRIDFVCKLTLLKVCIYCWLFGAKKKFFFRDFARLSSFGRTVAYTIWTSITRALSIIIINNQYVWSLVDVRGYVFPYIDDGIAPTHFQLHTEAMQTIANGADSRRWRRRRRRRRRQQNLLMKYSCNIPR